MSVTPPPPPPPLPPAEPTMAAPIHVEGHERVEGAFPAPGFLEHSKSHRSPGFYTRIFITLVIITIVEVGIFYVDQEAIRIPSLLLLSAAKFALVLMFFMHLKGERRLFSLLFVGPLFIGSAILVALVGLFQNW